jgi:hypothetical protein
VTEQDMAEYYAPPFEQAVQAQAGAIMCSCASSRVPRGHTPLLSSYFPPRINIIHLVRAAICVCVCVRQTMPSMESQCAPIAS